MIKVQLLRPLDGLAAGETAEFPEADAKRLEGYGAVKIVATKAEPAPKNKMAASPTNKGAKGK